LIVKTSSFALFYTNPTIKFNVKVKYKPQKKEL
jgi:hypothetical protein